MGRALLQKRPGRALMGQAPSKKFIAETAKRRRDETAATSTAMENVLTTGRLRREWRTMQVMVGIYCAGHAHARTGETELCDECQGFLDYAARRLEKCPYGPAKPTCARCPIHCYKPQPRERAREIMRYSGPRMMVRHPWLSLTHLTDKLRRVEHPMEARRQQRRGPAD